MRDRPSMPSRVSSFPHFKPCTVTTSDCIRAIGSELEFMNMDAAIANDRWLLRSLHAFARPQLVIMLVNVTITKMNGIIHSSLSFDGDKKKATFENRRAGVKRLMFKILSFFCVFLSNKFRRASIHPAKQRMKTSRIDSKTVCNTPQVVSFEVTVACVIVDP